MLQPLQKKKKIHSWSLCPIKKIKGTTPIDYRRDLNFQPLEKNEKASTATQPITK